MGKWIYKIKHINYDKNVILKAFLSIFLLIFYCFLILNNSDISFFSAGFGAYESAGMQIYIMDVGQATSVCAILPDSRVWILDTGSEASAESLMKSLDDILRRNNIHKIDTLLLSHSDLDHIGGATSILKKYQVDNILRPKILTLDETFPEEYKIVESETYREVIKTAKEEPHCQVKFIENETLLFDEVEIRIFAGDRDFYSETNAYSPIVNFSYKDRSFMFTGDVTAMREREFIQTVTEENLNLNIDFLMVSHHGSAYSTIENFLSVTNPKYAFVSSGSNLYPSQEVVSRLKKSGVKAIYSTDKFGMIGIFIKDTSAFEIVCMANALDVPFMLVMVSLVFFVFIHFDFFSDKWKTRYFIKKNINLF